MDNKVTYTKLGNLVGDSFTILKAGGYTFKKWDEGSKRFITSETYEEGFRKLYTIDTDKGRLDLGSGQLSSLLEATYKNGTADINGKTFTVKSNGKTGMDIRYYFNLDRNATPPKPFDEPELDVVNNDIGDEPFSLDDVPF